MLVELEVLAIAILDSRKSHTRWTPALRNIRISSNYSRADCVRSRGGCLSSTGEHQLFGDKVLQQLKSAAAATRGPRRRTPRRALAAAKPQNASERAAALGFSLQRLLRPPSRQ
jgi:hypothetical protein